MGFGWTVKDRWPPIKIIIATGRVLAEGRNAARTATTEMIASRYRGRKPRYRGRKHCRATIGV
jgi:hypothetical protein